MRVLMVGAGGVGDAAARIAAERSFFEQWVVADYDLTRSERTVASVIERNPGDTRFRAARVDASDAGAVEALAHALERYRGDAGQVGRHAEEGKPPRAGTAGAGGSTARSPATPVASTA